MKRTREDLFSIIDEARQHLHQLEEDEVKRKTKEKLECALFSADEIEYAIDELKTRPDTDAVLLEIIKECEGEPRSIFSVKHDEYTCASDHCAYTNGDETWYPNTKVYYFAVDPNEHYYCDMCYEFMSGEKTLTKIESTGLIPLLRAQIKKTTVQ